MFIHIGYPKTGSTWLQTRLFNHPDAKMHQCSDFTILRNILIKPNPLWYDSELVKIHIRRNYDESLNSDLIPVISNELLVGHPVSGGHNSTIIAERLNKLWPDSKILIVIREQKDMLISLYAEYVVNGGPLTLSEYLYPPGSSRQPVFDFRYLEFDRLIKFYYNLFEKDRIMVLPYELFITNQLKFCNLILNFAGSKPITEVSKDQIRKSINGVTIKLFSHTNRWFFRDNNNHVALISIPILTKIIYKFDSYWPMFLHQKCRKSLSTMIISKVATQYAESNQRCSKLIDIDLSKYGYDCG